MGDDTPPVNDGGSTISDMPPAESTSYRRLVEHVTGLDICAYVTKRMGEGLSRRAVARELTARIGVEGVEISDVLLMRWCGSADV